MTSYPVMETFYSVQGEGAHSGVPAFFIRLGGCDVGCVWCDVKESWDASIHPKRTADELADEFDSSGAKVVVITGGEPAMYDLTALCKALKERGAQLHIETSGVYPIVGAFDWVTFSPKKFKKPLAAVYEQADELKVIAFNKSDFDWALMHQDQLNAKALLYIQPEWSKREQMHDGIVEFVKANTDWRISIQTHKYLEVD